MIFSFDALQFLHDQASGFHNAKLVAPFFQAIGILK